MASPVARPPRPRGFWARLDQFARDSAPAALAVVLLLAGGLPIGAAGQNGGMPLTIFASVYFWTLYRPGLMPPWVVFGLGLLADLLSAAPLGVNTLILLLLHGSVLTQRRTLARQSFLIVWIGFALFATVMLALTWGLRTLLSLTVQPIGPAVFECGMTIAAYPILAWLFVRLERSLGPV
ncbi:MAG: rod shape-determining protein MreD [Acetobacteraceae bacterium]|nr:rod shape-determining protein MreD [Acetobacteraceae bacterium]